MSGVCQLRFPLFTVVFNEQYPPSLVIESLIECTFTLVLHSPFLSLVRNDAVNQTLDPKLPRLYSPIELFRIARSGTTTSCFKTHSSHRPSVHTEPRRRPSAELEVDTDNMPALVTADVTSILIPIPFTEPREKGERLRKKKVIAWSP